mgnify:CR=1 FL=1
MSQGSFRHDGNAGPGEVTGEPDHSLEQAVDLASETGQWAPLAGPWLWTFRLDRQLGLVLLTFESLPPLSYRDGWQLSPRSRQRHASLPSLEPE